MIRSFRLAIASLTKQLDEVSADAVLHSALRKLDGSPPPSLHDFADDELSALRAHPEIAGQVLMRRPLTDRWASIPDLLTALENLELPLLSWGVVTAHISDEEVRAAITDHMLRDMQLLGAAAPSVDDYLDYLVDSGLVRRVLTEHGVGYRTRIAEYIKLLKQLRQLFPPHNVDAPDWWLGFAPLVADYRLGVASRTYPAREVNPDDVRNRLHLVHPDWDEHHEAVLRAILGTRSAAAVPGRCERGNPVCA